MCKWLFRPQTKMKYVLKKREVPLTSILNLRNEQVCHTEGWKSRPSEMLQILTGEIGKLNPTILMPDKVNKEAVDR